MDTAFPHAVLMSRGLCFSEREPFQEKHATILSLLKGIRPPHFQPSHTLIKSLRANFWRWLRGRKRENRWKANNDGEEAGSSENKVERGD